MSSANLPTNAHATPSPNFVLGPGAAGSFVDRRSTSTQPNSSERRQFGSSHSGLSEAGRELAVAIDQYKLQNHRRYITCDEMLKVITDLGYSRGE